MPVRVSVLELPARYDGATLALADLDRLLEGGPKTDLAIVPETSFTGYVSPEGDFDLTRFAEPIDGPTVHAVLALAAKHRTNIVAPLILRDGQRVYNTAFVAAPDGQVLASYRKRHPWIPERWASKGTSPLPIFTIGDLRMTIAICYDGHFLPYDSKDILESVDALVFMSAWVDEEDSRMPLLRGLARRFHVAVANANWASGDVEVPGQGESCILDANGRVLAQVPFGAESPSRIDAVLSGRPR